MGKKLRSGKRRAMAVKPTKQEIDIIIDKKVMDKVERQKQLMKTFLQRILRETELNVMAKQIESKVVKLEWHGMTMPMEILKAQFNSLLHNYKEVVAQEEYYKQALRNDGLTDDQIKGILINSKYITDRKFLLAAEKKAMKEAK